MPHPLVDMFKKIGVSFIGQALPDTELMSDAFKDLLKATIAAILSALLVGAFFLMLGLGLYHYLVFKGFALHIALFICTSLFLILALISGVFSKVHFQKVSQKKSQMAFFAKAQARPDPTWKDLFQVFVSNMKSAQPSAQAGSSKAEASKAADSGPLDR